MIAAVGIYVVIEAAVILLGIMGCIGLIGFFVMAALREEKDRPLFPWGARARVERARAAADVIEQQTRQEVAEIKRLSLEPHRQRAIEDIREGRIPDQNGLPEGGDELRKEAFERGY